MRVLASPDKFGGSATARDVALAIADGVAEFGAECIALPMSDGGEGMLEVLGGANQRTRVSDPLGRSIFAGWQLSEDGKAVIESAQACGLFLVGGATGNDPWHASTYGVGELIGAALSAGARQVVVGVGGSATTDGGLGTMEALADLGIGGRDALREGNVVVCCDVSIRFREAARVFGPQKGASAALVEALGRRLAQLRVQLINQHGIDVDMIPGSGAAGGLAGALAAMGAKLVKGFEHVAREMDFQRHLTSADIVVTGEGCLDTTSFQGKVVGEVLEAAQEAQIPCHIVAGAIGDISGHRVSVSSLSDLFGEGASLESTLECVRRAVFQYLRTTPIAN